MVCVLYKMEAVDTVEEMAESAILILHAVGKGR